MCVYACVYLFLETRLHCIVCVLMSLVYQLLRDDVGTVLGSEAQEHDGRKDQDRSGTTKRELHGVL
jgi:hypothetical protein